MSSSISFEGLLNQSLDQELDGEIAASLKNARAALEQAQSLGDADACAEALARLGNVHYRLGHFKKMGEFARQSLSMAGQKTRARADALILLGVHAFETGSLEDAESYFLGAADLCRQIDYPHSLFRALHDIAACIYSMRGQYNLALANDEEAYRIACQIDSPQQLAPLIAMCNVCIDIGLLDRAQPLLEKIHHCVAPQSYYYGYYLMLVAKFAQFEGDFSLALSSYDQARIISEKTGDIPLRVFISLGNSYCNRKMDKLSCASEWANDAVEWASRTGNRRMLGRALTERGFVAWVSGSPHLAETDLRTAIQDLTERQQFFDLTLAQFYLAALLHSNRNPEAEIVWQQAVERILTRDYGCILDRNRELAYPLIAAFANSKNSTLAELSIRCITYLQLMPPPPVHIQLLGGYQIKLGGRMIDYHQLRKRRAGELLALLLLEKGRSLTFDQIADTFWGDKDTKNIQMLFHQATSSLRRILESQLPEKFSSRYLSVIEGSVTLTLPPRSTIDIEVFEKHCLEEDWENALAIYSGDFLPGYLYSGWSTAPRERLKRLYLRTILILAHRQWEARHPREAIDLCLRALEIDPWQEDAVLLCMQACLALNDRPGAIRVYQELERSLVEDLKTEPQACLQELYRSII